MALSPALDESQALVKIRSSSQLGREFHTGFVSSCSWGAFEGQP